MGNIFSIEGPVYRFLYRVVDLLLLNLLFILCCIPVITIGASMTALFSMTLRMVRDEDGGLVTGFLKAFRQNFKQSTVIWGILFFAGSLLGINFYLLIFYTGGLSLLILMGLIIFTVIFCMYLALIFPYLARYEGTIKQALINVFKIGTTNIYMVLSITVLIAGPVILMFFSPLWMVAKLYIDTFIGFSLLAYLISFIIRNTFDKYETN